MKNNKKIVFLNLFKIDFPITAFVSMLHRASGFFLFLIIPVLLATLYFSFSSERYFYLIVSGFSDYILLVGLVILAFVYHLLAGIRHLLIDLGFGDGSIEIAKKTAMILIVVSIVVFIFLLKFYIQ